LASATLATGPWPAPGQCQEWHRAACSSHWIGAKPGSGGQTPRSAPSASAAALRVDAVNLEYRLRNIETDRCNHLHDWLLRIVRALAAPTSALACRWRSLHSIRSGHWTAQIMVPVPIPPLRLILGLCELRSTVSARTHAVEPP
jgi:hypothetical protein